MGHFEKSLKICTALSVAIAVIILSFTAFDGEKYEEKDAVPAAIVHTPPEKPSEMGFWDIFTESVARLVGLKK